MHEGTDSNALVADTKDGLRIGDDDQVHLAAGDLPEERFFHGILVGVAQVKSLAPSEQVGVVRDCVRL